MKNSRPIRGTLCVVRPIHLGWPLAEPQSRIGLAQYVQLGDPQIAIDHVVTDIGTQNIFI